MQILQIRFSNLNSLAGEWQIDLTHPAFVSDGIFAITGPTGAGKSTILDAICLALYGRTPRLEKVNRSTNEIMSRRTAECFAEVTFRTQAGFFRCNWRQQRAHRKIGGALQQHQHEIADAGTGVILETRIQNVSRRIEEVTGMDFDRFTRSMLLAQGGFDTFLRADPGSRAPILEQITGTEIYSRISIAVHERRSLERNQLDLLQLELAGMPLLSGDEEAVLRTELELKNSADSDLTRRIDIDQKAIAWLDGLALLQEGLQHLTTKRETWQQRWETFQPERVLLNRAERALELAGEHAALTALRKLQASDIDSRNRGLTALPDHQKRLEQAAENVRKAEETVGKIRGEITSVQPLFRKVRDLDLVIQEKFTPITAAAMAITERQQALAQLRSKLKTDAGTLQNQRESLQNVLNWLVGNAPDAALPEQLAGIRSRFDVLTERALELKRKQNEAVQLEATVKKCMREWRETAEKLLAATEKQKQIKAEVEEKRLQLVATLQEMEVDDWHKKRSELASRKVLLEKVAESRRAGVEAQTNLDRLRARRVELAGAAQQAADDLLVQAEALEAIERRIQELDAALTQQRAVVSFEDARRLLQAGEPCPLCGSCEHPFAGEHLAALPDETAAALKQAQADRMVAIETMTGVKVRQAETGRDLDGNAAAQKELEARIDEARGRLESDCAELQIEAVAPDFEERLDRLAAATGDGLREAEQVVRDAVGLEKVLRGLRESLDAGAEALLQIERDTRDAGHRKESAVETLARVKIETDAVAEHLRLAQEEALRQVAAWGIAELPAEGLGEILRGLTMRRDQWVTAQERKLEAANRISALEIETRHQEEQVAKAVEALEQQQEQLKGLREDQDKLIEARCDLFGDRQPDEEESRLTDAAETAGRELDGCRELLQREVRELEILRVRIAEFEGAIAGRAGVLAVAETAFRERLSGAGFADEQDYTVARLPDMERRRLKQAAEGLAAEGTELDVQIRDKAESLETERARHLTEQPREVLERETGELTGLRRELQREIGAIVQKLSDNELQREKQRARIEQMQAQKRECLRWDNLHQLIGSADGKKFRNFAQSLTFEIMIGHANRQLRNMMDRYLLVRDSEEPLALNVIDNYQAGEIRSTKNLSGGESFIVSLALALGLSQMAGRNVRVDSLFLDEGFGTLDEEALDMALETLAGLRQEGKLIGVISHVGALKERIGAQVRIVPQAGGRSVLEGPGVTARASA